MRSATVRTGNPTAARERLHAHFEARVEDALVLGGERTVEVIGEPGPLARAGCDPCWVRHDDVLLGCGFENLDRPRDVGGGGVGVDALPVVQVDERERRRHEEREPHEPLTLRRRRVDSARRDGVGEPTTRRFVSSRPHLATGVGRELVSQQSHVLRERGPQLLQVRTAARDVAVGKGAGRSHGRFARRRLEERVLRREVAVDRRDRRTAAPGHVGHRDLGQLALGDQVEHRVEDPLPGHAASAPCGSS